MFDELISTCSKIKISSAAADAFSSEAERMADTVGDAIARDPQLPEMIGYTPYTVLRGSQTNRALLMKFILRLEACDLLVRTVAWEYRTLHARGVSLKYFPLEFAAWKRAVQRHLDPSSAEEVGALFTWLMAHHETMIGLASTDGGLDASRHELDKAQESFLTSLLLGDTSRALELADHAVHDVAALKSFYLDTVSPVLRRVGVLWEKNEISVAEEHLATAIVGRIAGALYLRFVRPQAVSGKTALVAAGPHELHEIGARLVADFLELEGWQVTYLGGNLSEDEIICTLKRLKPFLLSLSVTSVFHLDAARQLIQKIKSEPETQEVRIMLGGFVFNCLP